MKYLMIVAALLMLSGCERQSDQEYQRGQEARATQVFEQVCLKGVSYYFAEYGYKLALAPVYNKDSTIRTCN